MAHRKFDLKGKYQLSSRLSNLYQAENFKAGSANNKDDWTSKHRILAVFTNEDKVFGIYIHHEHLNDSFDMVMIIF